MDESVTAERIEAGSANPELDRAVIDRRAYVAACFDALRQMSADGRGVTRPSYCDGEHKAHAHLAELATQLGLTVTTDPAGNLLMSLPGRNPDLPQWITGSHLDSVREGGNFDGAAGVVAGLTALAALKDTGHVPDRTLTAAAWRAEEAGMWFSGRHGGHLGSRSVLGLLDPAEMETALHADTGLPLGEMMRRAGFDPDAVLSNAPILPKDAVAGYTELHIEQGPVLEGEGYPVGIVTGIRGNYRVRNGRIQGIYSHSGGVPRSYRADAVFALADLIMAMDAEWTRREIRGEDLVITFGQAHTDTAVHALVKVPGEAFFTADIRSQDRRVLEEMAAFLKAEAQRIEADRRVAFTIDPIDKVSPAVMDAGHRADLRALAGALDIAALDIPSGGGHDAADFHDAGIPASMIFIRNDKGSHNPDEAMTIADFMDGTRLLAQFLATRGRADA